MSLTPRHGPRLFSMIEMVEEMIRRNLAADPYFYEDPNDTPLRLARAAIKGASPSPRGLPLPNGSNTRFATSYTRTLGATSYTRTLGALADIYDMSRWQRP